MTRDIESLCKNLFFISAAGMLLFMSIACFSYGVTWDEWMDSNLGMLFLRYFLSAGKDKSFLDFWHGYLYCEPVYMLTGLIYGLKSGSLKEFVHTGLRQDTHLLGFYATAHFINALFGFTAMLYTGLTAKELASKWRTGLLALLFIFLSPRFLGNSMNDTKDIPFAGMYIFSIYYMVLFLKELPAPKWRTIGLLSFGISATIWIRVGGILLIAYLWLFGIMACLYQTYFKKHSPGFVKVARFLLLVSVLSYFGGLILWPYGQMNPLKNPWNAIQSFSHFNYWEGKVLFEGLQIKASNLPWYYIPKWILISTPLFMLAGFLLLIIRFRSLIKEIDLFLLTVVGFTALFPIVYINVQKSIVYDTWRHLFFAYPPMVVLAALSWDSLWNLGKTLAAKTVFSVILALHLMEPLTWIIRNHPLEAVYFNPIVGGTGGAMGRYDTDYWGFSFRKAAEWLAEHHKKTNDGQKLIYRADGSMMLTYPYLRGALAASAAPYLYPEDFITKNPYFSLSYIPLYKNQFLGAEKWDYAIVYTRDWNSEDILSKKWPPAGTVYEVKVDNATLCAVVKNPSSLLK